MRLRSWTRHFAPCAVALAPWVLAAEAALAQGGGGGGGASSAAPGARAVQRKQEGLYFSEYLSGKKASAHQDMLYRFYTSSARKPRPRVEPFVYGLIGTAHTWNRQGARPEAADSAAHQERTEKTAFTAAGYGGEVYFNNFLSGTTGLPTLNIVAGVRGERVEDKGNVGNEVSTVWGPSLRLFGANQQDTALFLSYVNTRRSVLGERCAEWAWQGGGRLYVLPVLALEGEAFLNPDFIRGKPSPLLRHTGFRAGGFLELSIVRLGVRFSRDDFDRLDGAPRDRVREDRRSVFLGVAY